MSKDSIADYDATAANNTDVGGIAINGSSPPSNFDNALREMMSHMKVDNTSLAAKPGKYNHIINGDFDIWQRATSQTSSGYGSADRWRNTNTVSSKTYSQQEFTLGQTDVLGNPKYYSRTVVTSTFGASASVINSQRIENVKTLSGKTTTLTFWAKADASKDIATEFRQHFGTGGSPSSNVDEIGITTLSLTTSWQKFSYTIDLPSVSGKTLGTDNNDYLQLYFWLEAGSDYDARTNSLGQQSGTFDIAHVSLVEGDATGETDPFTYRTYPKEELLCFRYFYAFNLTDGGGSKYKEGTGAGNMLNSVNPLFVPMRVLGAISHPVGSIIYDSCSSISYSVYPSSVTTVVTSTTAGSSDTRAYNTGGKIHLDAEL